MSNNDVLLQIKNYMFRPSSGFIRNYMLKVFIQCAPPCIDVEISPSTCQAKFFLFFLYGLGVDSGSCWSGPMDWVV